MWTGWTTALWLNKMTALQKRSSSRLDRLSTGPEVTGHNSSHLWSPSRAARLLFQPTVHLLHRAATLEAAWSGLHPGFHALGLLLGLHNWEPSQKGRREGGKRQGGHGPCKAALSTSGSAKAPSWGWCLHGHQPGRAGPVAPLPGELLLYDTLFMSAPPASPGWHFSRDFGVT